VLAAAILVEPKAGNAGRNVACTQALLAANGYAPKSLVLLSKPYME
jgi:hypothetical protein